MTEVCLGGEAVYDEGYYEITRECSGAKEIVILDGIRNKDSVRK